MSREAAATGVGVSDVCSIIEREKECQATAALYIENEHIRGRTHPRAGIGTDQVLASYGTATQQITVPDGGDALDASTVRAAIASIAAIRQI